MRNFLPQTIFAPQGQIGRGQFWAGLAAIVSVDLIATRLVEGSFFPDPYAFPGVMLATAGVVTVFETLLVANRLRDLQWPAWIALPFVVAINAISIAFGLKWVAEGSMMENVLLGITAAALAAEVVICGILPGRSRGTSTARAPLTA